MSLEIGYQGISLALDCPDPPKQISKDFEGEVNTAVAKIGPVSGGELKTKAKNTVMDLLGKLPNADRVYLEQMMFAAYCSGLRDDKALSESQKTQRVNEYIVEVRKTFKEHAPKTRQPTGASPLKQPGKDGMASQLVVEGVNDPFSLVSQKDQPFPPKVTKFAKIKVLNVGGIRVTNVGVVVIKANGEQEGRFRLAVSSMDTLFERPNPPTPQVSVDLNPGEDEYFDAVIECNGKTCAKGTLAIPYIDNGGRFVVSPVHQGVALLEDFTVRVSGDKASAVTRTFRVKSSTDGYLSLQARED
jgi:hypothetical protein